MVAENILTLPSQRHINRLSGSMTVGTGIPEATINYLKKRLENLNDRERLVAILIDEVYTARQVEYQGIDHVTGFDKFVICIFIGIIKIWRTFGGAQILLP